MPKIIEETNLDSENYEETLPIIKRKPPVPRFSKAKKTKEANETLKKSILLSKLNDTLYSEANTV